MPPALRVVEANARAYAHTWKGTVFSSFLSPVLFLAAMGLGLGSLVEAGVGPAGGSYLAFIAPGLMAATAMQTGAGDSSWPFMSGFRWTRTFHAVVATPVRVADLVAGHLGTVALRLALNAVVFAVVVRLFGVAGLGRALLAVPAAALTGTAVSAAMAAFTASRENDEDLALVFRFGIVPMFLLSGAFFPITELPGWVQPVAAATPLYHGVELARGAMLATAPSLPIPLHVAYLTLWLGVGGVLTVRSMRRRLTP